MGRRVTENSRIVAVERLRRRGSTQGIDVDNSLIRNVINASESVRRRNTHLSIFSAGQVSPDGIIDLPWLHANRGSLEGFVVLVFKALNGIEIALLIGIAGIERALLIGAEIKAEGLRFLDDKNKAVFARAEQET